MFGQIALTTEEPDTAKYPLPKIFFNLITSRMDGFFRCSVPATAVNLVPVCISQWILVFRMGFVIQRD